MLGHRRLPARWPGKGLDKLDHRGVASSGSRCERRADRVRSMHWRGSREPHITIRTGGSHRRGTSRPPVLQPCWWASSMESIPTPAHVRRSPVAGRCVHVNAFPESGQCVRANVQGGPFWAVLDRLLVCASSGRDSASLRRTLVACLELCPQIFRSGLRGWRRGGTTTCNAAALVGGCGSRPRERGAARASRP